MRSGVLRRMAVHRKLMTMLMVTSGAALLVVALASLAYNYVQFRRDLVLNLASSASLMLANTRGAVSFDDAADARDALATLGANSSVRIACLYAGDGTVFAEYRAGEGQSTCPASPPAIGHRFGPDRLELVQRDQPATRFSSWLLLESDLSSLTRRLRTHALITTGGLLGALLLAFLLSSSLQRIVSQPVVELAELARAVSVTGDYSRRATKRTDDELGVLAESFNSMLERITNAEAEREAALVRERQANRTKDEFLATLSHELRTPLSAILGWTQLLRRKGVAAADVERGLERIERNAHSQNRLINDLLDVSRILSGKLSLDRQHVDLVPVTKAAVDSLVALAQSRNVALHAHFGEERLLAFIDADRISQVMGNLLSNALKFTPAGGRVTVSIRRLGEMQELSVTDTGAGISAEFLPRVFEPFRQADASHTRTQGGLGLGLAIVKRIIEMHGGDVTAESEGVGKGACFTVRLPAAVDLPQTAEPRPGDFLAGSAPDLSRFGVLVVDDDLDSRDLVVATLATTGARTASAGSADEAVALALESPPDVLITDIAMPNQDGYTLVHRLRQLLGARMPRVVIAVSAFAADADIRRSLDLGFDAHVTKPFDPALLLATINERLTSSPS